MKKTGKPTVVSAKTHEGVKTDLLNSKRDLNAAIENGLRLKVENFELKATRQDKFFSNLHFTTPTGFRLRWERKNGALGTLCEVGGKEVAKVVGINSEAVTVIVNQLASKNTEVIEFSRMDFTL